MPTSYEAVTEYCGFDAIEAGKTMGLFPYGSKIDTMPLLKAVGTKVPIVSRDVIFGAYPNSAILNIFIFLSMKN